jgi:phosphomannomutase
MTGLRVEGPGRFRLAPGAGAERLLHAIGVAVGKAIGGQGPATGDPGIVVGADVPERWGIFGEEVARGLTGQGLRAWRCDEGAAAPMVAFEVLRRHASGGVVLSQGDAPEPGVAVTLLGAAATPLPPALTALIGRRAETARADAPGGEARAGATAGTPGGGLLRRIDPRPAYLERLRALTDLNTIARVQLRVAVDSPSRAARSALAKVLGEAGWEVTTPEDGGPAGPGSESWAGWPGRIEALAARVRAVRADLGLTTDGAAGRLGLVDAGGAAVDTAGLLGLLLRHLVRMRGWRGGVARAVGTSHLVDAVARREGVPVFETDGDLSALGELVAQETLILADDGEGGLTVRGHLPLADAVLGGLLAAEVVAAGDGLRLGALVEELQAEVGPIRTWRACLPVAAEALAVTLARLERAPTALAGRAVVQITRLAGVKLGLEDGSWVLLRPGRGGIQITVEAARARDLGVLAAAARRWAAPDAGKAAGTLHAGKEKPDNLQLQD